MSTELPDPAERFDLDLSRGAVFSGFPQAGCVAALEDIAEALPVLAVGPFAQWSQGEVIAITGRIKLRGFFDTDAVRWVCLARGSKGLFGKGYIAMPPERVAHLPLVK